MKYQKEHQLSLELDGGMQNTKLQDVILPGVETIARILVIWRKMGKMFNETPRLHFMLGRLNAGSSNDNIAILRK